MRKSKLTFKVLNELVEFRTSIAIITSVFIGTGYSYYINKSFNLPLFLAMLSASIMLDGAATVFNHYFDFRKARAKEGYLYNVHNPIVAYNLPPSTAFLVGTALIGISGLLGIYIILSTHWILLFIGGASILIAYFYSAGKYPISYTPFGELVSGLFEGSIVISIAYFIQSMNYSPDIFLVSIPTALGISNIMLANNTCDTDEDIKNGRNTLPIVIGQDKGVKLLYITHILIYTLNTLYYLLGKLPVTIFLTYLIIPVVIKNLNIFSKNRTKANGFVYVLKNTIVLNSLAIISIWLAASLKIR